MTEPLEAGNTASQSVVAGPEHFASVIVPGTPSVFSTPSLCGLVEKTAAEWIAAYLEPGRTSVGTELVVHHTAASPSGFTVTATVRLVSTDGRRYVFEWSAFDDAEQVGSGTHERFVVDSEKFMARVAGKVRPQ